MKRLACLPIALGGLVALTSACGGASSGEAATSSSSAPALTRCYELVEGDSRAVIKVESAPTTVDPQGGQVTVYSFLGGVEEFPPETTAGRLEADAFVYGDGTTLVLTAESLTWPADSLLEGAVFNSTSCP
ncbi:MAG: hypothetical protein ACKOYQ_11190 [Actinomycetota bacterium]